MRREIPQEVWDCDIATTAVSAIDWLWHGFLARGNFTLLTGQWKGGKTTLLAMLLARRHTGGVLPSGPGRSGG